MWFSGRFCKICLLYTSKILYKAEITNKVVLVFFVVNLLRIDLYDVVKEIKKGRDTMKTIKMCIRDRIDSAGRAGVVLLCCGISIRKSEEKGIEGKLSRN